MATDAMIEAAARAMAVSDYDIASDAYDEFWVNPRGNHWLMQEADEWDNGVLVRLGRAGYRRHARIALTRPTADLGEDGELIASLRRCKTGPNGEPININGPEAADRIELYREALEAIVAGNFKCSRHQDFMAAQELARAVLSRSGG